MERKPTPSSDSTRRPALSAMSPGIMVKKAAGMLIRNWYWFTLSLVLFMAGAWFYVKSKQPVYLRSASIMIKQSGNEGFDKTLRDIGVPQASTNLVNEILLMNSSVVAEEVVRRLHLDVDYYVEGPFYDRTVYGVELPFRLSFLDLNDNDRADLTATLVASDSTVLLSGFVSKGAAMAGLDVLAHPGDTVQTPMGRVAVALSQGWTASSARTYKVHRSGMYESTERVRWRISANLRDRNSSIIDVRYKDVSLNRADDILNTLVTVYNEQWMKERNKQIISTNDFIRDRLSVIEQELGSVDHDISSYKSENLIIDIGQSGAMAMAEANETAKQDAALRSRISQVRAAYDYLASITDDSQQIPFYSNISNAAILHKISEYNTLVLKRNNHLSFSSAQNPLVMDLNQQLASIRASIIQDLSNEIADLQSQQSAVQSTRREAVSKVARNPGQANHLLSVERQQKVKESLYLFLLQKREENELSQAFTAYNTQLIEPAHGSWLPIEPVASSIYLIALLLGLALPAAVIALKEVLTTTVQGREDLNGLLIPFAGEIPEHVKNKRKKGETPSVMITDNGRDMINEAFRVVRSNLEFLLGYEASHKVIMLTSMDPGSGKTFISANLASVIGLKGKKVLAIDLDMRRASLSGYAGRPHKGVSGYLSGQFDDYHPLIVHLDNIDILPCGALPPNPSELLYTQRFADLVEAVKTEYDYVFLDCPPVEMVADPAIINRFADLTVFVVRAKVMEKSLLPEIDRWYMDRKFNNMVLFLNGTDVKSGRYGYHKYGYHKYGYSYYGSSHK
ncbi:MAG: polysaccharide biosynthesis tyrosine autokinase [Bacteroidales bacterium]|nr:polysaccharide biosynthesis tyrosine autokinase [Bacteroidales bacterium]